MPGDPVLTTTGIHDSCGASSTFKDLQRWLPSLSHPPLLCLVLSSRVLSSFSGKVAEGLSNNIFLFPELHPGKKLSVTPGAWWSNGMQLLSDH